MRLLLFSLPGNFVVRPFCLYPASFSSKSRIFEKALIAMNSEKLKSYLREIADQVDENTTLDDIYTQLELLRDIDESEDQVERGDFVSHADVRKMVDEWLR